MDKKKNVALVLSSGGARGFAHIGVIEGLLKEGYQITSIAGSSMGALVGAFYAAGQLDTFKKWAFSLDRMDVFKLIDFTFSTQGFIKGEKVFHALEELIPDQNIQDMKIPFCAIATDYHNKKELVLSTGSMYRALKASVAIPTVVRPVEIDKIKLIDGGVLNPIPVKYVARTEGDILVISNVNADIPYEKSKKPQNLEATYMKQLNSFRERWQKLLPGGSTNSDKLGYFDLLNVTIDLMQDRITNLIIEHYEPDLHVKISRDAGTTFEFYRAKELVAAGATALEKARAEQ